MRRSFKQTSGLSNINGLNFSMVIVRERTLISIILLFFKAFIIFYTMIEFTGRNSSLEENSYFIVTSFFQLKIKMYSFV